MGKIPVLLVFDGLIKACMAWKGMAAFETRGAKGWGMFFLVIIIYPHEVKGNGRDLHNT